MLPDDLRSFCQLCCRTVADALVFIHIHTGYSSVGRASDCRHMQQSDGPWLDSGWPDFFWKALLNPKGKGESMPRLAGVSWADARTGLQLQGHGDMQGFDSSSAAKEIVIHSALPLERVVPKYYVHGCAKNPRDSIGRCLKASLSWWL